MATDIRPIRTKRDYEAVLKEIERGARRRPQPKATGWMCSQSSSMRTRLSIYPMDPPDPIGAIEFRMEQQGLTRGDPERSSAHTPGSPRC
jgi:HTH-type transcriptional regulator / antitoxin HigA